MMSIIVDSGTRLQPSSWLLLRVDMRTIYGMIEREELPSIKVGRVIRIPSDAVESLLRKKP
ncbi:MAG: helix-turn-helix domain-containing protein, partial [Acidobacteriota bacterium]|nr:helix-turn-helix domain-containing protein [Acidobacteriota bacterium]